MKPEMAENRSEYKNIRRLDDYDWRINNGKVWDKMEAREDLGQHVCGVPAI